MAVLMVMAAVRVVVVIGSDLFKRRGASSDFT